MNFSFWKWYRDRRDLVAAIKRMNDFELFISGDYKSGQITDEELIWNVTRFGKNAVPLLIKSLFDNDNFTHSENVMRALGVLRDRKAIPALLKFSSIPHQRMIAIEVLQQWKDDSEVKARLDEVEVEINAERERICILVTGVARRKSQYGVVCALKGYFLGTIGVSDTFFDLPYLWASDETTENTYKVTVWSRRIYNNNEISEFAAGDDTSELIRTIDYPGSDLDPNRRIGSDSAEIFFIAPQEQVPPPPFVLTGLKQCSQIKKFRCIVTLTARQFGDFCYFLTRDPIIDSLESSLRSQEIYKQKMVLEARTRFPLNIVDDKVFCPMLVTIEKRTDEYSYLVEIIQVVDGNEPRILQAGNTLALQTKPREIMGLPTKSRFNFGFISSVID